MDQTELGSDKDLNRDIKGTVYTKYKWSPPTLPGNPASLGCCTMPCVVEFLVWRHLKRRTWSSVTIWTYTASILPWERDFVPKEVMNVWVCACASQWVLPAQRQVLPGRGPQQGSLVLVASPCQTVGWVRFPTADSFWEFISMGLLPLHVWFFSNCCEWAQLRVI